MTLTPAEKLMARMVHKMDGPVSPPNINPPKRHPLAGRTNGVRSTSRRAYKSVDITGDQNEVYVTLLMHDSPMCDHEILSYLARSSAKPTGWKMNMINGRRNELVDKNLVEQAGSWSCSHTKQKVIHWQVTKRGSDHD